MKNTIWKLLSAFALIVFLSINLKAQTVTIKADPVCFNRNESVDLTTQKPDESTLEAIYAGIIAPTQFSWEFGDGNTKVVTTASVKHSYSAAGKYYAKVTITYDNGKIIESVTKEVIVYPAPQVVFNFDATEPYVGCADGQSVKLSLSGRDAGSSVLWNTGATDDAIFVDQNMCGGVENTRLFSAIVYNPNLCRTESQHVPIMFTAPASLSVTVKDPQLDLMGVPSVQTELRVNTDKDFGIQYTWFPTQGINADATHDNQVAVTFTAVGLYTYKVEGVFKTKAGDQCKSSAQGVINVIRTDVPTVYYMSQPVVANKIIVPESVQNNKWVVQHCIAYNGASLDIYDRWGKEVYNEDNIYHGDDIIWDGAVNGKLLPEGAYYYVIKGKDTDNKVVVHKGSISILHKK